MPTISAIKVSMIYTNEESRLLKYPNFMYISCWDYITFPKKKIKNRENNNKKINKNLIARYFSLEKKSSMKKYLSNVPLLIVRYLAQNPVDLTALLASLIQSFKGNRSVYLSLIILGYFVIFMPEVTKKCWQNYFIQ